MSLWHKDSHQLVEALKKTVKLTQVKNTFIYICEGNIPLQGCLPLSTRKRTMAKSLEILIIREGKDLNTLNSHNLVYCVPSNVP